MNAKSNVERVWPLSPAQQGMLMHVLRDPSNTAYQQQVGFTLRGPLDIAHFREALQMVCRRQAVLRTAFVHEGVRQPLQVVLRQRELPVRLVVLGPGEELAAVQAREMEREDRPFDLVSDSLFRLLLIQIEDEVYRVIITFHHLILDGWSLTNLLREVLVAYEHLFDGQPLSLNPPFDYGRFLVHLASGEETSALNAWSAYLDSLEEPEGFPSRFSSNEVRSPGEIMLRRCRIPCQTRDAIGDLARRLKVTQSTVMVATFGALMARLNASEEAVVGLASSGRPAGLEGISEGIGLFVCTLPFRTRIVPSESFERFLLRVQAERTSLSSHEQVRLADLADKCGVDELFRCLVGYENYPELEGNDNGTLKIDEVTWTMETGYDFTITFHQDVDVEVEIRYNASRFSADEVDDVIRLLFGYLESLCRNPEQSPALVPLTTDALVTGLVTDLPQKGATLYTAFNETVQKWSDRPAITDGDRTLTYAQLDAEVEKVAVQLREVGVRPGSLVGVFSGQSADLVIAEVAVLKCGGAFLPLDECLPSDRVQEHLLDAKVNTLVLCGSVRDPSEKLFDNVIRVQGSDVMVLRNAGPATVTVPVDAAYVIYTSGSTGRPKGVVVGHRSVLNFCSWHIRAFEMDHTQATVKYCGVGFDASVWEVFPALLCGAHIVVVPEYARLDPASLDSLFKEHGVTVVFLPTPIAEQFFSEDGASLRHLIVGGDKLNHFVPRSYLLENAYGPTENTIVSTWYTVRKEDENIPIGRPIDNTFAFVADGFGNQVPRGYPGELCVGGAGLSLGYLERPEETATKFVELAGMPNKKSYRTGDRAVIDADGCIRFLGRIDTQVKVRGYRIELGEIDARIMAIPGVEQAVTVLRRDAHGDPHLVAFYVGEAEDILNPLLSQMPMYMMPERAIRLDALPLTHNGKVDRRALTNLVLTDVSSKDNGPLDEKTELVSAAFVTVLGAEGLGSQDDFFHHGGDSIKAIQVSSLLRRQGWKLDVATLYECRTAEAAGRVLTRLNADDEYEATSESCVLGPVQRWFFEELGSVQHFAQSVLLFVRDGIDLPSLRRAVRRIVHHHDALRMRFQASASGVIASCEAPASAAEFEVECVDLRGLAQDLAAEQVTSACEKLQQSFDLEHGPLFRVCVFETSDGAHVFLTAHHLVVDAVSWRILLNDLWAVYAADRAGSSFDLGAKSQSYSSWARDTEATAQTRWSAERAHWAAQAPDGSPSLAVLANVSRGDAMSGERLEFTPEETSRVLGTCAEILGLHANEVLVAALAETLSEWTGRTAFRLLLESHGRDGADVARTVGWFTSVYPHVVQLGDGTARDRILRVKDGMRRVPDNGIGYNVLRYSSDPEIRAGMVQPEPEISVNFLGAFDETLPDTVTLSPFSSGLAISPGLMERHLVEIEAHLLGGSLRVELQGAARAKRLRQELASRLRRHFLMIGDVVAEIGERVYSPGDFKAPFLTAPQVAELQRRFGSLDAVETLPLGQRGLLLEHLRARISGVYHVQVSFTVNRELTENELAHALRRLAGCHDMLRSRFEDQLSGEPIRVVVSEAGVPLVFEDLRSSADALGHIRACRSELRTIPFDLRKQAPLRAYAWLVEGRTMLLFEVHHIAVDGWSVGILLRGLLSQLLVGEAPEPSPSFSAYQHKLSQSGFEASKQAWNELLAGLEARTSIVNELPESLTHPGVAQLELDKEHTAALERLARDSGVTLNVIMEAFWATFLGEICDSDDVVYGRVVSGRRADIIQSDEVVGPCINTIPQRVQLTREDTIPEIARKLQESNLRMLPHETCPLSLIQNAVPFREPLFDHIFIFENYPVERSMCDEFDVSDIEFSERTEYPVDFTVVPGECMLLTVRFDEAFWSRGEAEALLQRFDMILEQVLKDPTRRLSDLKLVLPSEQQKLKQFNDTFVDHPAETVVAAFARQVSRRPSAIAVRFGDVMLTFEEVDRRSDAVALWLRDVGVRPGALVGLLLPRSEWMAVSILGVLKTGAGYVPLGVHDPVERRRMILRDCQAAALLADPGIDRDPEVAIPVQDPAALPVVVSSTGPIAEVLPEHPAYVIYTSGSTGSPKGVLVEHRSVMERLRWTMDHFAPGDDGVILQKTPYTFDVSVVEQLLWAVSGSSVVFLAPDAERDPEALVAAVKRYQVTDIHFVPSMLEAFLDYVERAGIDMSHLSSLRLVRCSGEGLQRSHVAAFKRFFTIPLLNMYGPTETTVEVTWHECELRDAQGDSSQIVTIGSPMSNVRCHILNRFGVELPAGFWGELALAGPFLARGYIGLPELTAERFPITADLGRLYLTGDRCEWSDDGKIHFSGRFDQQVKLRGYRIETSEIEACLLKAEGVRQAVVALVGQGNRAKLVAYYVSAADRTEVLVEYLRRFLPPYMMPAHFVRLDELPLSHHGKLLRSALPTPDPTDMSQEGKPESFSWSKSEGLVASVWAEVFGAPPKSRDESFLDYGGDSIKAIEIAARLHQQGFAVDVNQVFKHPSVASLAAVLVPLEEFQNFTGRRQLTPTQRWFFRTVTSGGNHWNQSLLITLEREVALEEISAAFDVVARQHEALRTVFPLIDEERVLVVQERSMIAVDEVSVVDRPDVAAAVLEVCQEAQSKIDVEHGPIGAMRLIRTATGPQVFLAIHHLVTDIMSLQFVFEDVAAVLSGEALERPGLSPGHWGGVLASSRVVERFTHQRDFWLRQQQDYATPIIGAWREHTQYLDVELSKALLGQANKAYGTEPLDLLVAGFLEADAAARGITESVLTFEGHGREPVEAGLNLVRSVGWFTTLYPVRFEYRGDLANLVCSVKETLRRVPDHGIGYGVLLNAEPPLLPAEAGIPDVLFNFTGVGDIKRVFRGSEISELDAGPMISPAASPHAGLVINILVDDGRLVLSWTGGEERAETMVRLPRALASIVEHCSAVESKVSTPSDFGDPELEIDDLFFISDSLNQRP